MMGSEEARSSTPDTANELQDERGVLTLEKEILAYAIRRINEAKAEGRLNGKELDTLASEYNEKMEEIERALSRNESITTLRELYKTQENLGKQFNNLNEKIQELESRLEIKPGREASEGAWIWSRKGKKEEEKEKRRLLPF